MKHTPISSSDIQSVGYDQQLECLEINFRSTGVYRYHAVPKAVADGLIASVRPGIYYLREIKGRYTWERVKEAAHA